MNEEPQAKFWFFCPTLTLAVRRTVEVEHESISLDLADSLAGQPSRLQLSNRAIRQTVADTCPAVIPADKR